MDWRTVNLFGDDSSRVDSQTIERISKEMVNLIMKQIAPSDDVETHQPQSTTTHSVVTM
jgi:hypothetical protein